MHNDVHVETKHRKTQHTYLKHPVLNLRTITKRKLIMWWLFFSFILEHLTLLDNNLQQRQNVLQPLAKIE